MAECEMRRPILRPFSQAERLAITHHSITRICNGLSFLFHAGHVNPSIASYSFLCKIVSGAKFLNWSMWPLARTATISWTYGAWSMWPLARTAQISWTYGTTKKC